MSTSGFVFIIISAFSHVLWNAFLKVSKDKTSAIAIMMAVTVVLMAGFVLISGEVEQTMQPPVILAALASGFFFFLYQFFVARSYMRGDLSAVYPLTVTGPIYIPIWGYIFLDERISMIGFLGILLILYGAVAIQANQLIPGSNKLIKGNLRETGALFALLAAFFYSFGAITDKIGVTVGTVAAYTFNVCVVMLLFHLAWMAWNRQGANFLLEMRQQPGILLLGGIAMALSFVTFRIGLQEIPASYATALRQVSSLFSIGIGFFIFRETFGITRIIATAIIVAGVILIRMG